MTITPAEARAARLGSDRSGELIAAAIRIIDRQLGIVAPVPIAPHATRGWRIGLFDLDDEQAQEVARKFRDAGWAAAVDLSGHDTTFDVYVDGMPKAGQPPALVMVLHDPVDAIRYFGGRD